MAVVPRWEWRTFGDIFGGAEDALAATGTERIEESDEVYFVSEPSDVSAKIRGGVIDVKERLAVDAGGLEQWRPVIKDPFPLPRATVARLVELLGVDVPLKRDEYTLEELHDALDHAGPIGVLPVHKRRARYAIGGCMAEVTELTADGTSTRTVAVEAEDPERVRAVVHELGLEGRPVACMASGLKALVGLGGVRYGVIDVGTNSVKFVIGEREPDTSWRMIVDRAEVTRLGEGLADSGRLGAEPIERTVRAIAGMADEARAAGTEQLVAVATAGMRIAANSDDLIEPVRERCGIEIEVISGDEEARLGYVAVAAALPDLSGSLIVFETGGGSSQFTFGHGKTVDERFSVDVGAARFTEQFGLDGAVDSQAVVDAGAAIADALAELRGRDADTVVGMGGAITNMAAVQHGLAEYDPSVVQGAVLERAEVERQIELYRTSSAEERRSIPGLQPGRAEVILAGACIVASVLDLLERDSVTVSDRGLRHGLLAERFGAG